MPKETVAAEPKVESRFFVEIHNPTLPKLVEMSKLVALEMTNDKPIRFTGAVPMWEAPPEVTFIHQQKLNETDPDEWLMFHPSMLE